MKKILLLTVIFFIYGCGYTSIYKNNKTQDLLITVNNIQGDYEMNNYIKNQLKQISNSESTNVFNLDFITKYEKSIISKDTTGAATNYELNLTVTFNILHNEINKQIQFNESFNIKSNTNNYEQQNYEKTIKRNFATLVKEKLTFQLLKLNDN